MANGLIKGERVGDSITMGIPDLRVRPLSGTSMSSEDWGEYLRGLKLKQVDMTTIDTVLRKLEGQPVTAVLTMLGEEFQA